MGVKNKTLEDKILEIEKAFKEYFDDDRSKSIDALVSSISQMLNGKKGIDRKLLSIVLRKISAGSDFFVYYRRRFILIGEKYLVKRRIYYLFRYNSEHSLKTDTDISKLSSYLFSTKISAFVFDKAAKLQKSLEFYRRRFLEGVKSAAEKDGVFVQVDAYTDFINKIFHSILLPSISDRIPGNIESIVRLYTEIARSLESDVKKRSRFYSYMYEYVKFIVNLRTVYSSFLICGVEDFYYRLTYDYMFLLSDISGGRDFVNADYMFFIDYCYNVLLDRYVLAGEMAKDYIEKLEKDKDKLVTSKKAKRVYLKTLEFVEQNLSNIDRYIGILSRAKIGIKSVKS